MNRTANTGRGTANVYALDDIPEPLRGALRTVALLLASLAREELPSVTGDDWIDQRTSPLGRRRHRELAKSGAFPAFFEGRRWLARRADVDAYIEGKRWTAPLEGRPANDARGADDEADDPAVRAMLAEADLELAPKATTRKGRR